MLTLYLNIHTSLVNTQDSTLERPHDTIHPPFWGLAGLTGANGSSWKMIMLGSLCYYVYTVVVSTDNAWVPVLLCIHCSGLH